MALDQALLLIREDVCEWLNRLQLQEQPIPPSHLMDSLKSGVLIHRLACFISTAAATSGHQIDISTLDKSSRLPSATTSSFSPWLSRDRISRFLLWCRSIGLRNEVLFESEGLLSGKDERTVIITLLKIAKFGAKFHLDVPELVKIEEDLDENSENFPLPLPNVSGSSLDDTFQNIKPRMVSTPNKSPKRLRNQTPLSQKRLKKQTTSRIPVKCNLIMKKEKKCKSLEKADALDDMAIPQLSSCSCIKSLQWQRISSGHYKINGHSYFLRIFKKNIMVRIGGGWQTLEDFLIRKDPCRK